MCFKSSHCLTLSDISACQVPICAVAADGLTIHTNKWFLGAGFLGELPDSHFFIRRLVTTCYGVSIVAEQELVIKSWMSRVKHPMLRLSQSVTT